MKELIDYINQIIKLSPLAIAEMERLAEIEVFRKNEYILEQGQRCNKIWFAKKGMVRKFHVIDGNEITTWIHAENDFFTSLQSYSQNKPSSEYLQACEDCEVIGISKTNSLELAKHHEFVVFSTSLMEREFVNIDIHTKELNSRDAKGKYEYLQQIAPEMVKRAKLGHIASILGISQETLSRIRKI